MHWRWNDCYVSSVCIYTKSKWWQYACASARCRIIPKYSNVVRQCYRVFSFKTITFLFIYILLTRGNTYLWRDKNTEKTDSSHLEKGLLQPSENENQIDTLNLLNSNWTELLEKGLSTTNWKSNLIPRSFRTPSVLP